ncbi:MAG: 2-phospho-L-lactate guanylyltransferase [Anaerolineales bacterium]
MTARKLWALVPVKRLGESKTRLKTALSAKDRRELAWTLYRHTLQVLAQAKDELSGILVVSTDEKALAVARARGLDTLRESGERGLNAALRQGSQRIADRGGEGVLVLPIDLPRLAGSTLREALAGLPQGRVVAIAPDRKREGTNALVVAPLGLIDFQFGPGSFRAHLAAAGEMGSEVVVWESEEFAYDVDVAEDLSTLPGAPLDGP